MPQSNCQKGEWCGHTELNYEESLQFLKQIKGKTSEKFNIDLPLHFTIFRKNNENSEWNDESLENIISSVNSYYINGMSFYVCAITIIDNDNLSEFEGNWQEMWDEHHVDDAINVYCVDKIQYPGQPLPYAGVAPGVNAPINNAIALSKSLPRTVAHELGHYFGLQHTHQFSSTQYVNSPICYNSNVSYWCDENFDCNSVSCNGVCWISGDGLCDTPADPGIGSCVIDCGSNSITCTSPDPLGVPYSPDGYNIMSYYTCNPAHFSQGQSDLAWATLNNHPNRQFLLNTAPSCEPILSSYGRVEKVCNNMDNSPSVEPFPLVTVNVENLTESTICSKKTSGNTTTKGKYNLYQCGHFWNEDVDINVNPLKDDVSQEAFIVTNGVTTYDLVLMTKHIQAVEQLPNKPYSWIAADVNFSGTITTYDMVLIRKVILGISDNFLTGSWRYVPSYYMEPQFNFSQNFFNNPFSAVWFGPNGESRPYLAGGGKSYMDEFDINLQNIDVANENTWSFQAIKTGDVDCNAKTEEFGDHDDKYSLVIPAHDCFEQGETAFLTLKGMSDHNMSSYQLGFRFDPISLKIIGVEQGDLMLFNVENFGLTQVESGELRTIWLDDVSASLVNIDNETAFFKLKVEFLKQVCNLSTILELDDAVLKNVSYDGNGSKIEDIQLSIAITPVTLDHNLTNVFPNPISNSVNFQFALRSAQPVTLQLFDGFGNSIIERKKYALGISTMNVPDLHRLKGKIIYYRLVLGDEIFFGSFVKIQ